MDRARSVRPGFQLDATTVRAVVEICRRLDGLPLAIELAAARIRHLAPTSLLDRLERRLELLTSGAQNLPPRQRTLRDAIAWSYDLLLDAERRLFRHLGIFAGGFSLDAAEHLARAEWPETGAPLTRATASPEPPEPRAPPPAPLDLVASLVEKSLISTSEGADGELRYTMLETIREFALEALAAAGETPQLRRWHRDWFLALAERAEPALVGSEQVRWLDRLQADHDNLRAAMRWCLDAPDVEAGLRFGGALWRFWEGRNHLSEGRAWLDRLLALDTSSVESSRICRAQLAAGRMAFLQGDFDTALRFLEPALRRARDLGDRDQIAFILTNLGHIARERCDLVAARACYDEGLALWRALDDARGIAISLLSLGRLAVIDGRVDEAARLLEDSLRRYRALGDLTDVTRVLLLLGAAARGLGRLDAARAHYVEGLRIAVELRDRGRVAANLQGCAILAATEARAERAVLLTTAAAVICETTGTLLPSDEQRRLDAAIAPMRQQLGPARCAELAERARRLTLDEMVALALDGGQAGVGDRAGVGGRGPIAPADRGRAATDDARPLASLTQRERQVAESIGRGLTNREIAAELIVSRRTVEWHVSNLLRKLGASSRAQLAARAAAWEPRPRPTGQAGPDAARLGAAGRAAVGTGAPGSSPASLDAPRKATP